MSSKRIHALDGIKFAAAICIIFHHYQAVLNVQFEGMNFNNGRFYFGYLVELFFVISGFLAYSGVPKIGKTEAFSSFFAKRCIRLMPINILAATVHILVIYVSYHGFHVWGWVVSAFGLFAVDPSFAAYGVNPPCWYVSVLLICSICFYAITYWSKNKSLPLLWLYAAMVLTGLLIQLNGWNFPLVNSFTGRGLFAFFTGLLLRHLTQRYGASRKLQLVAVCILLTFMTLYIKDYFLVSEGFSYLLTLFVYPCVLILCASPLCQKICARPWLSHLGEVSFGMYLLHTPVLYYLHHIETKYALALPFGSWKFMLLFTGGILALSFVSLYTVERPVSKKLLAILYGAAGVAST